MITIYIYTAKIISVSRTCYDRHDIFKRNFSETIHKGGGFFKFNGTKEEFIHKVVKPEYLDNPTGYILTCANNYRINNLNKSQWHVEANENSYINGLKLNDEFINFLNKKYKIGKTYLSYGQEGAGIFIIEDNDFPVLDF